MKRFFGRESYLDKLDDNQAQALGYAGIDDLVQQSTTVAKERTDAIVAQKPISQGFRRKRSQRFNRHLTVFGQAHKP